ncbi:nitrate reductase gamma subunit [Thermocatellispora tengchongensis]|uniref:Nitrate reductase-like protein NarX n=1 Tax=Thermocatellispora tengchongensis TaxID=1073253 RepID=A0A840PD48_9ACTN|nr:respiratory nitrate reductase subunit gamma [Thermocatellispora tengchongensis]MBB5135771.1 nitrate reductase gamma subunit [Thermocatellispora tengchongensis]
MNVALWVVIPYVALTIFVVGHVWRWRVDQFGWTTRTTQVLESRLLRLGSPLFHLGSFAAIAGHALGLLVPKGWTEAAGIDDHLYHLVSVGAGTAAGLMVTAGLALLLARRLTSPRVRRTTTRADKVLYAVLTVVILLGLTATVGENLLGGGYDYRATIAVWFRGVLTFRPDPDLMAGVPPIFQLHAMSAWLLAAIWPFTRLVHVWSAPIAYLWRPYIVYRRRAPRATTT